MVGAVRTIVTSLVLTLVLIGGAGAAATQQASRQTAPRVVTLFKHGHPAGYNGYQIQMGTVPAGQIWTLKRVLIVSEKHTGQLPGGGEFTVSIFLNGVPIAESSTATGQRVNYQGQGMVNIDLPPGTRLSTFVWLASGAGDPVLGHYYFGSVALIQERRFLR